jgi:transposase
LRISSVTPGDLIERRVRTTPGGVAAVLGDSPRDRILLEASTESECVARCLEGLGHEVIVADTNFAPMYATARAVPSDVASARKSGLLGKALLPRDGVVP